MSCPLRVASTSVHPSSFQSRSVIPPRARVRCSSRPSWRSRWFWAPMPSVRPAEAVASSHGARLVEARVTSRTVAARSRHPAGVRSARRPSRAVVCERLPRGVASRAFTVPPSSRTASPVASWPLGSSWKRSSCARWNASAPPGPSRAVSSSSEQPAEASPRQVRTSRAPSGNARSSSAAGARSSAESRPQRASSTSSPPSRAVRARRGPSSMAPAASSERSRSRSKVASGAAGSALGPQPASASAAPASAAARRWGETRMLPDRIRPSTPWASGT